MKESDELAERLTPSLVELVVGKDGELEDDSDVVSVLCGLGSGPSLSRVEDGGGLVALSLLASKGKVKPLRCLSAADVGKVVESGGHLSAVNVVCNRGSGPEESVFLSLFLLTSLYSPSTADDVRPALQVSVSESQSDELRKRILDYSICYDGTSLLSELLLTL